MSATANSIAPVTVFNSPRPAGETTAPKLERLARRSIAYLVLRYGLSMLINVGNMLVLTWWIGPHAYGIFVTAVAFTTFLSSLSRFGVDTYLVRCDPAPAHDDYHAGFTVILALSLVLLVIGVGAIPILMRWYSGSEFVWPYLALLTTVPLIGIAGPPFAKLERALDFRSVSAIELAGQLTALLVSIVLAIAKTGVWAPVGGFILWQVVTLVTASARTRFLPKLRLDWRKTKSMLEFGFGFSASIRAWQLRTLVNPLLVGRFAGPEAVAYVGLAIRIAEALSFVRTAAGRLAIAGLARLQHDRERFQSALQKALEMQVASLGPLLCFFAIAGPWIVPRLLGSRWLPALDVYAFVAAGVLINSVFNLQASALFVIGRQWAVLRAYGLHVVLLAIGSALLIPRIGIRGYGWAELVACLGYLLIFTSLSGAARLSYRKLLSITALFLAPLLLLIVNVRNVTALSLPVFIGFVTIGSSQFSPVFRVKSGLPVARHCKHLLTFLHKFQQRGAHYGVAVLHYRLAASVYTARKLLHTVLSDRRSLIAEGDLPRAFHFQPETIPQIVESIPQELKNAAVYQADNILMGRFVFRGRELRFTSTIDWQAHPNGSLSWQWDLNRHLFFLRLGAAYYYTGEQKYLDALKDLWRDWIKANPAGSANWREPFEVAARLQNWIWAYFLLTHSHKVDQAHLLPFAHAMREHADYLAYHLEYHWPNNHLLLESKALYEFALLFPALDTRSTYFRRSKRILEEQISTQILPDGVHCELSSMYHRVVAGELEELATLEETLAHLNVEHRSKLAVPTVQRIHTMKEFSRGLKRRDGSVPLLADSAEADTYIRFDFANPQSNDLNYWMNRSTPAGASEHSRSHVFSDSGYVFLRSPNGKLEAVFDCGPFSRCESQNHGHCDALSFDLHCHGIPWILDPGIYFPWPADERWTRHFRSTAAHNTVTIDRREQSELSEVCDVRRTARVSLLDQSLSSDAASVTGDCVPFWSDGDLRHCRRISLVDNTRVTIRDEISGSGTHHLDWTFQFAPEIEVTQSSPNRLLTNSCNNQHSVTLSVAGPASPSLQLFRGSHDPLRGWISRNSAEAVAATAAVFSLDIELPFTLEFFIDLSS